MGIDLKDKRCTQCLGIPLEWFWGKGRRGVVFGSFLVGSGSVFARLGGQMAVGFGAGLLPRGLAFTAEHSLLFLLAVGRPLLAGAAVRLGLFDTCPCWERPSPFVWVTQGKTGAPPPPSLQKEHLPAAYWTLGSCCHCQDTAWDT